MRISGTTASLAGLEKALKDDDEQGIELAVRRILLLFGIVWSMGGIPLVYLGDEVGKLNDYSYLNDPELVDDSRYVHRGRVDWEAIERRHIVGTVEARIFQGIQRMLTVRKGQPAFGAAAATQVIDTDNWHVFAFIKRLGNDRVMVVGNFTDQPQTLQHEQLLFSSVEDPKRDLLTGREIDPSTSIDLQPYELIWMVI